MSFSPFDDNDWDLPPADLNVFSLDDELKVNAKLRLEDINALNDWVRREGLPETKDFELVKFLNSCNYNLDDAKSCVKAFYECREDSPDLFVGFNLETPNMKKILDVIVVAILPRRTPENYRIVYNGLRTSDVTNYVFKDVCRVLIMIIESIFLTEPTVNGVVMINDTKHASMNHLLKFGVTLPKKLAQYTTKGMPLKQHAVHLVHCTEFVDNALKLMSCFGSKKDWEKVFVSRDNDLKLLHDKIPKYCLPSELGGSLPSIFELSNMTLNRLKEFNKILQSDKI